LVKVMHPAVRLRTVMLIGVGALRIGRSGMAYRTRNRAPASVRTVTEVGGLTLTMLADEPVVAEPKVTWTLAAKLVPMMVVVPMLPELDSPRRSVAAGR
jgi:hypothetical protein